MSLKLAPFLADEMSLFLTIALVEKNGRHKRILCYCFGLPAPLRKKAATSLGAIFCGSDVIHLTCQHRG
jgi:hypothetical protein